MGKQDAIVNPNDLLQHVVGVILITPNIVPPLLEGHYCSVTRMFLSVNTEPP